MKKTNILFFILLTLSSLWFIQCDDMDNLYRDYIDQGERIYLGKPDSLIAMSGVGRIKLKWCVNADPKIEETIVYWNLRQDSVVKTFQRDKKGIQADSLIIENLAEGLYTFELFNRNKRGERSLMSTVQGQVYGENYIATLKNRTVTSMQILSFDKEKQSADIEIVWGPRLNGSLFSKISYKKRSSGEYVEVLASNDQNSTIIYDVGNRLNHPDDLIQISTLYQFENSFDLLETSPRKEQICVFTTSGVRTDYNSSGVETGKIKFDNIIKILRRVSSLSSSVAYDCNRVAEASSLPNTLFRLFLNENELSIDGYFNGFLNTISSNGINSFFPNDQKLTLNYKYKRSSGAYSIVEEEYFPANISFPVMPLKVYAFGENINGHFFTKGDDLIHVDQNGDMWVYRFNENQSFGEPTFMTTGWGGFTSVFYLPNNRIFRYDGDRVDIATINENYEITSLAWWVGAGWAPLAINRLMPFKDFALIMTNSSGVLLKLGINANNGWVGGFDSIASGFSVYKKIIPFDNSILAIDNSGDLWHMTLSDNFELGNPVKIGSGWNKYINVIRQGTALLAIDAYGDMWRYEFNPDLSWNVE